jgi:cation diffusion facilitator family transporter
LPRLTRNRSFLGVMLGLPYLHSLWHPQSKASATTQSALFNVCIKISSVGLIAGLLIVYFTNYIWLDNVVAILFGGIIAFTGLRIVRQSVAGIMDEADYDLSENIIQIIDKQRNKNANWVDLHNWRIIKYGSGLHIDCHLTIPWFLNVKDGHDEAEKVARLVSQNVDTPVEFFIHLDPCTPIESCRLCVKRDCLLRQKPFEKRIAWHLDNVLENKQHRIIP